MSVKSIRALLAGAAAITAHVADRVMAGDVPEGTAMPALGIKEISSVPVGAIDAQAEQSVVVTRVQVMVMAKAYPEVKPLRDLVRRACNFQRGPIAGVDVISIERDTIGPDLQDEAGNHFQSIDFKVTHYEQN